jgi:hypothetical protein
MERSIRPLRGLRFRPLLSWVGMIFAFVLQAQNMVPNGEFELLDAPCVGEANYGGELASWLIPSCCATPPIYHHPCSGTNGSPNLSAPSNLLGYQVARSGEAYCGLITYAWGDGADPQHFLAAPLSQPLQAGTEYCLFVHVSLADLSSFATASLHCVFGPDYPSLCAGEDSLVWPGAAQIVLSLAGVDTIGWTELSGSFVASGGEEYLTIGSLCTATNCDSTFLGWNGPPMVHMAEYYVDDVVLQSCFVGVGENPNDKFYLFPNPADTRANVLVPQRFIGGELQLFSVLGALIMETSVPLATHEIDVSEICAGVYRVRLVNGQESLIQSLIIE